MRADGTTFRPRCISDPDVTEDLSGKEGTVDGAHKNQVGVETMTVFGHQGAIRITFASCVDGSFWITLLSRGNGGNMYIDLPCQS